MGWREILGVPERVEQPPARPRAAPQPLADGLRAPVTGRATAGARVATGTAAAAASVQAGMARAGTRVAAGKTTTGPTRQASPARFDPAYMAGLRDALALAGEGLPVTVDELVREFGAEGAEDFAHGNSAAPEYLRAFARAVAERLATERPYISPHIAEGDARPLEGLPLLREDREFINRRTSGKPHRKALLAEYRRRWLEAAEAEPVEFRKANRGRYAANRWLAELGRR